MISFFYQALSVSYQIQGYLVHVAVIVKTKITFVLKQKSRDASPEPEVLPFSQICCCLTCTNLNLNVSVVMM